MPAWERNLLVEGGKQLLGIGREAGTEAQGGFTAREIEVMTTPGIV